MRLRDRLPELRDEIRRAAAESGARDVRVFGSVARGEERDDSDVDRCLSVSERGRDAFDADPAVRDAILYQIIVLGEAAKAALATRG